MEEYDEIQAANIFPSVQEDASVASGTPLNLTLDLSNRGSEHTNSHEVDQLKAQVESLRQQLAERDSSVNELQRQIQTDKRAHDKLKERYELFMGTSGSVSTSSNSMSMTASTHSMHTTGTSTRRLNNTSDNNAPLRRVNTLDSARRTDNDSTSLSTADMQRLHHHMDQLEADKDASLQKTLKLSVALAESKAKCSELESQLEEYQHVMGIQSNNHLFGGTKKKETSAAKTPKTTGRAKRRGSTGIMDSFLIPITDIRLNDSNISDVNLDSDVEGGMDRSNKTIDIDMDGDGDHDEYGDSFQEDTTEGTDTLGWSGRGALSYFSERGSGNTRRGRLARSQSSKESSGSNSNKGNALTNGLRGFRGMISGGRSSTSTSTSNSSHGM